MSIDHHIEDKKDKVKIDTEIDGKKGEIDFNSLKSGGVIKQRQKDLFTVRLRCPGGRVPVKKLKKIAEVAEKYGGDYVHISVRQSIEITYVNYKDFGNIQKELAEAGQDIASCGPRIRVPTACSGCEYNPNGLTDTQKMASLVNENFFGKPLTHKFKISFSGCPIDCARTNEMDLGFQGAVKPNWIKESYTGCRVCSFACGENAIESHKDTGEPIYLTENCLYCGDCIRACPTNAWEQIEIGWMVRCAGKHGRHPVNGHIIAQFVKDDDVPKIIQAVTDWYLANGKGKGRTRISTLLQNPETWKNFIAHMKPVLEGKAVKRPKPPEPVEIHF